jgi:hypothetical protein
MSIHIRVYPQPGSIGYGRTSRRRAAMQNMYAQRSLQLQSMRLQNELRTQQQVWAPGTVGQGMGIGQALGYNTGITGGLIGGYGRGGYASPMQVGYGFPQGGYGYPQQGGYGSAMQGAYGCTPSVGQYNGVSQIGGFGTVTNANTYGTYGGAYPTGYPVGYGNAGYGAGLLGGIGASIGNMFTSAFRGW